MNLKKYLAIAVPFMISTVTQPLLGAVDTAVIGKLNQSSYIGGIAIGTAIFNTLYWVFGFLRVSTSGFSSQSLGSKKEKDCYYAYLRPLIIGLLVSSMFILLQIPIKNLAMYLYHPDQHVKIHAITYFNILIWGAPFVLLGYVNLGWLMGRKHIKETLILQLSTNLTNIILDLIFVMVLKYGVKGVAYATLISQIYGFTLGMYMIGKKIDLFKAIAYRKGIMNKNPIKKIMNVNIDLIIRTICLLTMTNMFIAKGSKLGTNFLAANAILFQLQYIICYLYDGMANASSVFVGKSVGEKNAKEYKDTLYISNLCTWILSIILSSSIFLLQQHILKIFTDLEYILDLCIEYSIWITLFPFIIGIGLVYYGIFVGATYTKPIRNSMIVSLIMFIVSYFIVIPIYGNHGLWFSFILFSFGRSIVLFLYRKKLFNKVFVLK